MRLLQKLVLSHELVGEALVPYYRQLLPVFNLCMGSNKNLGDCIDYGQNHTPCLGELAASTLTMFELHGGPTAFVSAYCGQCFTTSAVFCAACLLCVGQCQETEHSVLHM